MLILFVGLSFLEHFVLPLIATICGHIGTFNGLCYLVDIFSLVTLLLGFALPCICIVFSLVLSGCLGCPPFKFFYSVVIPHFSLPLFHSKNK
jgi:hypothetical protein